MNRANYLNPFLGLHNKKSRSPSSSSIRIFKRQLIELGKLYNTPGLDHEILKQLIGLITANLIATELQNRIERPFMEKITDKLNSFLKENEPGAPSKPAARRI